MRKYYEFSNEQLDFIKENYADLVHEVIHETIDNQLIYDADIKKIVFEYATITELLNGEFTMFDLFEELHNEYYNDSFADIAEILFDSYLLEEQKDEILNL